MHPEFVIWAALTGMTLLLLLANLRAPKAPGVVTKSTPEAELPEPETAALEQEIQHWTAQALVKLGYSKAEARRVALTVPPGKTIQQAIQWCLNRPGVK